MIRALILMGALLAPTVACTQQTLVVERAKTVIARYCRADALERQAVRAQLTTARGPLVVINCENLG